MNNQMMGIILMAGAAIMVGAWFISRRNGVPLPIPQQQRLSDAGQQPGFMADRREQPTYMAEDEQPADRWRLETMGA
jgi:hypothetical protein